MGNSAGGCAWVCLGVVCYSFNFGSDMVFFVKDLKGRGRKPYESLEERAFWEEARAIAKRGGRNPARAEWINEREPGDKVWRGWKEDCVRAYGPSQDFEEGSII